MYSLDRGWRVPVSDSGKFSRVHVNEALTNNHSQVFHGGHIKGEFRDFEGETMFPKTRKDLASSLMM